MELNSNLKENNISLNTVIIMIKEILSLLTSVTPFFVLIMGIYLSLNKDITIGSVIALYTYAGMIFAPASQLISTMPEYEQIKAAISRINHYMEVPESKKVIENISSAKQRGVFINNLSIGTDRGILTNVNLNLVPGKIYILTGSNGSGKSMFGKAISGLIPIDSGDVKYKNINNVFYIPTNNYLFSTSLRNNLTMGLSNYSEDELNYFIREFNLVDKNLKLDTNLNNYGHNLSTGQIQKIKLIRALLSHPQFLIIDEVLENMDSKTKNIVWKMINNSANKMIILVITHNIEDSFKNKNVKILQTKITTDGGSIIV